VNREKRLVLEKAGDSSKAASFAQWNFPSHPLTRSPKPFLTRKPPGRMIEKESLGLAEAGTAMVFPP
jgi:hypothetical protein